jgi:hypothetical protein
MEEFPVFPNSLILSWSCTAPGRQLELSWLPRQPKENFLFLPRNQEHIIEGLKKNCHSWILLLPAETHYGGFQIIKIITRIVVASYKKYCIH